MNMQIRVITGIENNILHIVKNEESAPFRFFFFFFFFAKYIGRHSKF